MKNYFELKEYKKVIFYISIFLFIALILTRFQENNMIEERFNFYQTKITGRISKICSGGKLASEFTLNSSNLSYNIFIRINSMQYNGKQYFDELAQVGDSISKPAYSDTIYLYRKDTVMCIYFNKNLE